MRAEDIFFVFFTQTIPLSSIRVLIFLLPRINERRVFNNELQRILDINVDGFVSFSSAYLWHVFRIRNPPSRIF